jgi:lipopolysaccharide/colanic/teichoic acid biosynthesis glycosyltransferase
MVVNPIAGIPSHGWCGLEGALPMTMVQPRFYRFSKRALDLLGSLLLLALLAPLLAAIACLVRWKMGAPALFRQERAGLRGRPFHVLKFRSMNSQRDAAGRLLPDLQRITPLGRFLRRSSLDELPQLWNVVKGDMSLVGPRPLYVDYVPRYSPSQRRRLEVRPGITGLAQVSGRITLGWTERLGLDVEYVDRACLALDLAILVRTLKKVLATENVPETGVDPTRQFQGDGSQEPAGRRDPREGA